MMNRAGVQKRRNVVAKLMCMNVYTPEVITHLLYLSLESALLIFKLSKNNIFDSIVIKSKLNGNFIFLFLRQTVKKLNTEYGIHSVQNWRPQY